MRTKILNFHLKLASRKKLILRIWVIIISSMIFGMLVVPTLFAKSPRDLRITVYFTPWVCYFLYSALILWNDAVIDNYNYKLKKQKNGQN